MLDFLCTSPHRHSSPLTLTHHLTHSSPLVQQLAVQLPHEVTMATRLEESEHLGQLHVSHVLQPAQYSSSEEHLLNTDREELTTNPSYMHGRVLFLFFYFDLQ